MGDALHLALWKRCRCVVGLGSVERAEYRLLARDSRGVRQALRLRGGCGEARVTGGAPGRAGYDGASRRKGGRVFAAVLAALRRGQEFRDGKNGRALGLYYVSCQGRAAGRGWARAHGTGQRTARRGSRLGDYYFVSEV